MTSPATVARENRERLSSMQTLALKLGAPVLLAFWTVPAVLGVFWLLLGADDSKETNVFLPGALAMCAVSAAFMYITFPLKRVSMDGEGLIVSNYWHESRIPYAQVSSIHQFSLFSGIYVKIALHEASRFGRTIVYRASYWPALGTRKDLPATSRLRVRVADHQHRG